MKKFYILLMFLCIYVMYSCLSASSQTINTTKQDTVTLYADTIKKHNPIKKIESIDSLLKKRQMISKSLDKNVEEITKQNVYIDSLFKVRKIK